MGAEAPKAFASRLFALHKEREYGRDPSSRQPAAAENGDRWKKQKRQAIADLPFR
jgi:hypothetical protein